MDARPFGGGGILDPDGVAGELAAWKGRIDQLAADTKAMSDRLEDLRVTTADGDGLVEVTVDATGALMDLQLGRLAQRVSPDELAQTIMVTVRAAKAQIAPRAQELLVDTVGEYRRQIHPRVICYDEFGPLNLMPRKGKAWRPAGQPARLRATYTRSHEQQGQAIARYVRWRNARARPKRGFAINSKIRSPGWQANYQAKVSC